MTTPSTPEPTSRRGPGRTLRLFAVAVTLTMVALVGADGAAAATATRTAPRTAPASSSAFGDLRVSKVTGQARNGARFAGRYHVTRFVTRHHRVMAVGRLTGTLTRKNGAVRQVSRRVRMPLNLAASRTANTTLLPQRSEAAAGVGVCNVLNLVLGPLDLNLLGLVVHLDRVVLNITAVPGAGALLGNLLCAVAGLLDGVGLGGLNAILTNLLNALLGILSA